jgi:cytochrome c peroxidase
MLEMLVACSLFAGACGDPATPLVETADPSLDSLDPAVDPATGLRLAALPPVPPLPEWPENPPTEAKKRLGRAIFWDPRLSGSGTAVCSSCHLASAFFQSAAPLDTPDRAHPNLSPTLHRHTPSLLNVAYAPMARWDGSHFTDLADIMVLPLAEANMNLSGLDVSAGEHIDVPGAQAALKQKLTVDIPGYVPLFQEAFGDDIGTATPERVWRLTGLALAVYIRLAVSRDAPFDAWNAGDDDAIDSAAKSGAALFVGKARCHVCHSGPMLSDFQFHNISTSPPDENGVRADDGRFLVTGVEADRGKFLTPMLRSSAQTSPYLHDGSVSSIREVVRHVVGPAGRVDPLHSPLLDGIEPLSDDEIDDLVQFMKSLTGAPIPAVELAPPSSLP